MRNLRAELRDWSDDRPIEWQPAEGDILVGFIQEPLPDNRDDANAQLIIEEERTGLAVAINLKSPIMGGLFDLHNPRCHDRIGIKCVGHGLDGEQRFVMIVDRKCASDPAPEENDISGAGPEERDFIEEMMSQDPSTPETSEPKSSLITEFALSVFARTKASSRPVMILSGLLTMLCLGALLLACPNWLLSLFHISTSH